MPRKSLIVRILHNWLLQRLLIGLALTAVLISVFLYLIPVFMIGPLLTAKPEQSGAVYEASDYQLKGEAFEAETSDHIAVKGIDFPIDQPKAVVILIPGKEHPTSAILLGHVKMFADSGYAAVIFDPRARGESGGNAIGFGTTETRDVDAVIEYVRSRSAYVQKPIILFGVTTGGAAAINTAAENKYVGGVISLSSYYDTKEYLNRYLRDDMEVPGVFIKPLQPFLSLYMNFSFGFDSGDKTPSKSIAKLTETPVMLIHSERDPIIPASDAQALYKASGGKATLWLRDSDNHMITTYFLNPISDAEYASRVLDFIASECLAKPEDEKTPQTN